MLRIQKNEEQFLGTEKREVVVVSVRWLRGHGYPRNPRIYVHNPLCAVIWGVGGAAQLAVDFLLQSRDECRPSPERLENALHCCTKNASVN